MILVIKRPSRTKKEALLGTGCRTKDGLFSEMGYFSFRGFLVELTLIHIINLIHPAATSKISRVGLKLSLLMARFSGSLLRIRSDLLPYLLYKH